MPSAAPALRHIAGEIVIAVRREDPCIDVRVTVVPEAVVAPDRIVIDVVIGERPEQRPDPSISAVAVLPPSVRAVAAACQPANAAAAAICPRAPGLLSKRPLCNPPLRDSEFIALRMLPDRTGAFRIWPKFLPP